MDETGVPGENHRPVASHLCMATCNLNDWNTNHVKNTLCEHSNKWKLKYTTLSGQFQNSTEKS